MSLLLLSRNQQLTTICRRLLASQQRITRFGEIPEMNDRKPTHIIVGAGSAGCVLANRLSEDSNNYVLLVEAGCRDDWWRWSIHMPSALMYNTTRKKYNWYYYTGAQKHMNDRTLFWPRGRVWGGSSSINAMVHIRGHPYDYDRWEREGAVNWSFKHCLPYFKKSETCHNASNDVYRGKSGPIHISVGQCNHPLHQSFMQAGIEAGYEFTDDMNGYRQEGVGRFDLTIHNGERQSTSKAYLWPILDRPNLKIASGIWVTRVLFDRHKAIGIEMIPSTRLPFLGTDNIDSYAREKVYCQDSVILCGGAINTPQLMMLSGLGPGVHLNSLEIPIIQDMPGVGLNLQDHLEVYVQQRCKQPITYYNKSSLQYPHHSIPVGIEWIKSKTGIGASCHLESGAFVRRNDTVAHPDVEMHFLPSIVRDDGRRPGTCHAYQLHIGPLRSQSKGYIMLRSRDARVRPIINPNYLSFEQDRVEFRDCIRIAREIFAQNAFADYRGDELAPGLNVQTNSDIDTFVNNTASSAYHPSGTCKMGPSTDSLAVINAETMAVHAIDNLYIVDASVIPSIVSGNLNAPTVMIAERAADIIRKRTQLPTESPPIWAPTISS